MCKQIIGTNKKSRWIAGNFSCHADAAIQYGAHRLMELIRGFTQSHWMMPVVECLHHIATAAAIVIDFEWNTQNTNKTQLLASNYGKFWSLVVRENFMPQNGPYYSAHRCDKLRKNVRQHDWYWNFTNKLTSLFRFNFFVSCTRQERVEIEYMLVLDMC